jgi:hypothetical protein
VIVEGVSTRGTARQGCQGSVSAPASAGSSCTVLLDGAAELPRRRSRCRSHRIGAAFQVEEGHQLLLGVPRQRLL